MSRWIRAPLLAAVCAVVGLAGAEAMAAPPDRVQSRELAAGRFDDGSAGLRTGYASATSQVRAAGGRVTATGTAAAGTLTAGRYPDGATGVRKASSRTRVTVAADPAGSTQAYGTTTVRTLEAGRTESGPAGPSPAGR
ncbi:MAG: hypothetical protein EA406_02025 [Rhodospirillales bacterium]|nr:MAG: hypothetical protein EA406_02025 [Rhodospirillales bacterium]